MRLFPVKSKSRRRDHACLNRAAGALLLTASLCSVEYSAAQNEAELSNLLFEPVLLSFIGTDGQPEALELTTLPTGERPFTPAGFQAATLANTATENAVDLNNAITGYENRIRDLELAGGAYNESLSQEYLALGTLHQAAGEHAIALEHFETALHNTRVNGGLFTLDQEEIIRQIIKSQVALGDLRAADAQQEYLFYLKRRIHGSTSVEMLPALTEYAEWNIFAFDARLAHNPAEEYAAESDFYTENPVNNSFGEENYRTVRLVHAQNLYHTILNILLNNFGVNDPRILDIERKLALTNYFFATNFDINSVAFNNGNNNQLSLSSSQGYYEMSRVSSNSLGYRHGREALERRISYMEKMEGLPPEELTRARLELGDWLMIFKKRVAALEAYQQAYAELEATGASPEVLENLFNPLFPQTIPAFINYRYTRASLGIPEEVPLDYKGWIDIQMEINRYGQPQQVEVVGRSLGVTDPIETRLLRQLRSSSSFRPRFQDGKPAEQEALAIRYYYTY